MTANGALGAFAITFVKQRDDEAVEARGRRRRAVSSL